MATETYPVTTISFDLKETATGGGIPQTDVNTFRLRIDTRTSPSFQSAEPSELASDQAIFGLDIGETFVPGGAYYLAIFYVDKLTDISVTQNGVAKAFRFSGLLILENTSHADYRFSSITATGVTADTSGRFYGYK